MAPVPRDSLARLEFIQHFFDLAGPRDRPLSTRDDNDTHGSLYPLGLSGHAITLPQASRAVFLVAVAIFSSLAGTGMQFGAGNRGCLGDDLETFLDQPARKSNRGGLVL